MNQKHVKDTQEGFRRSLVWVGEGQREDRTPGGQRHIFQDHRLKTPLHHSPLLSTRSGLLPVCDTYDTCSPNEAQMATCRPPPIPSQPSSMQLQVLKAP